MFVLRGFYAIYTYIFVYCRQCRGVLYVCTIAVGT